jgi:hypothetical protein
MVCIGILSDREPSCRILHTQIHFKTFVSTGRAQLMAVHRGLAVSETEIMKKGH